jgi:hypothetical protein
MRASKYAQKEDWTFARRIRHQVRDVCGSERVRETRDLPLPDADVISKLQTVTAVSH